MQDAWKNEVDMSYANAKCMKKWSSYSNKDACVCLSFWNALIGIMVGNISEIGIQSILKRLRPSNITYYVTKIYEWRCGKILHQFSKIWYSFAHVCAFEFIMTLITIKDPWNPMWLATWVVLTSKASWIEPRYQQDFRALMRLCTIISQILLHCQHVSITLMDLFACSHSESLLHILAWYFIYISLLFLIWDGYWHSTFFLYCLALTCK